MSAFIVARFDVHDPETLARYGAGARASLEAYGAEYILRSTSVEVLEGELDADRVVVLRFPSKEEALRWWNSDAYRPLAALRQSAATGEIFLVED